MTVVAAASPSTWALPGLAETTGPPPAAAPMMAVRTPGRSLMSGFAAGERVTLSGSPSVAGGPTVTRTGTPLGWGSGVGFFSGDPGTLMTLVDPWLTDWPVVSAAAVALAKSADMGTTAATNVAIRLAEVKRRFRVSERGTPRPRILPASQVMPIRIGGFEGSRSRAQPRVATMRAASAAGSRA